MALDRRPDRRHLRVRSGHPGVGHADRAHSRRTRRRGRCRVGAGARPPVVGVAGSRRVRRRPRLPGLRRDRARRRPGQRDVQRRLGRARPHRRAGVDLGSSARRAHGFGDFWQHCLVAEGALDLAIDAVGVAPYDIAAVRLIVEEAGGTFTDRYGNATHEHPPPISSNGRLHDRVIVAPRVDPVEPAAGQPVGMRQNSLPPGSAITWNDPSSSSIDRADLAGTELLGLVDRRVQIVDLDVDVETVLAGLRLGHSLEPEVEPVVVAVEHDPVGALDLDLSPDQRLPEPRQRLGVRAVDDDLVQRADGHGGTVRRMATPFQITIDCADADAMSRFWSIALGYVEEPPPAGFLSWEDFLRANDIPVPPDGSIGAIVDPDDVGPRVLFLRVPEPKTVKNRVHLDIRAGRTDDDKQTKVDRARRRRRGPRSAVSTSTGSGGW